MHALRPVGLFVSKCGKEQYHSCSPAGPGLISFNLTFTEHESKLTKVSAALQFNHLCAIYLYAVFVSVSACAPRCNVSKSKWCDRESVKTLTSTPQVPWFMNQRLLPGSPVRKTYWSTLNILGRSLVASSRQHSSPVSPNLAGTFHTPSQFATFAALSTYERRGQ